MQLVLIAHRCRTAFQIRNITVVIGNNQRTFKLSGICRIDTEISRKFHRTTYSLGNIDKRAVTKYSRVQGCKEIIAIAHHGTKVFFHQIRMLAYGFTHGTENNSLFHQCFLKGCLYRNRVHHSIDCHSAQRHLLFQWNTQFIKCLHQFRIDFVHALRTFLLLSRVGIIRNGLIIYFRNIEMSPCRHFHCQPMTISFQTELQ